MKRREKRKYSDYTVVENIKINGQAKIGRGAIIGSNVNIYGICIIGSKTYIGENCIIGFPARDELIATVNRKNLGLPFKSKVEIGRNVIIRPGCALYSDVKVEDNVEFGHNVLVREKTIIENYSRIGSNVVLDGNIKIGSHVLIQTGAYISTNTLIKSKAFLGPYCLLLNDKYISQREYALKGPTICEGASIGGNAIIMPAVTVAEGAVVGAGALVTKDVPSKTVVAGIPAKKMYPVPKDWRIKQTIPCQRR